MNKTKYMAIGEDVYKRQLLYFPVLFPVVWTAISKISVHFS